MLSAFARAIAAASPCAAAGEGAAAPRLADVRLPQAAIAQAIGSTTRDRLNDVIMVFGGRGARSQARAALSLRTVGEHRCF